MPDNHPQIDILSAPDPDCLHPVYNCLQYCFLANDFQVSAGSAATFQIDFTDATNQAAGTTITIAGVDFLTGLVTSFDRFQWTEAPPLTLAEIADNCAQMLNANFAFFEDWQVSRSSGVGVESVVATARENKFFNSFAFSFPPPIAPAPAVISANGTDPDFLSQYTIIIEVWSCDGSGQLQSLLSRNGYEPSTENSSLCVDLSRNLSALVSSTFPGVFQSDDSIFRDAALCQTICLRFGQAFNEGADNCDLTPQYFETTTPITIINAAFQKPQEVESINSGVPLMTPFCYDASPTRFLTNYPTGLAVCPDGCFWLTYNLDIDLTAFANPVVRPTYRFFYTDNTVSPSIPSSKDLSDNDCWSVPAGPCQLDFLADPLKTIDAVETTIILTHDGGSEIISESFVLNVDNTKCCCTEFYFLNELGGFDTIVFNCETDIDLQISSAEICGFENCTGDIFQGGKAEADRRAFETFKVFSQWNEKYFDLDWFRSFLKSAKRFVRVGDQVFKIKLLTDEIALFRFEQKIFVELDYVLSFELNQQND